MARKIVVQAEGKLELLTETLADHELQLQELVKQNPDLLPVEEFGMETPLLVIGRETPLRSGAVDLVAVAKGGELLVIEFKTGPQNTDFRHALSQLLDYGSDLWDMTYDEFEQTVPVRYFSSDKCEDTRVRGKASLAEAAFEVWGLASKDFELVRSQIREQLESGAFHYLLVAQRFTSTIESTIEYLNAVTAGPRFYAVELVRFAADGVNAFESRTIMKGAGRKGGADKRTKTTVGEFLDKVPDGEYRRFLEDLLDTCTGLKLKVETGDLGLSLRVPIGGARPPYSIGWLYPPGTVGWERFTDVTLGYARGKIEAPSESLRNALNAYTGTIGALPGARRVVEDKFDAFTFGPEHALQNKRQIRSAVEEIVTALRQELG